MEENPDAEWLRNAVAAAERGDVDAQKELAEISGRRIEEIGMESLDGAASEGNSWALLLIGRAYDWNREACGNAGPATSAYADSAAKGNPYAMAALAEHYEKGDGKTRSLYNAYLLHRKAASAGLKSSAEWLDAKGGDAENLGRIIGGSEEGDAESRYLLALEYERGEYVERSPDKALALLMAAAGQGHEEAAFRAAETLIGGMETPAFRGIGICMLAALAENGNGKAQSRIRSMTPFDLAGCDCEDLRGLAAEGSSWAAEIVSVIDGKDPDEHFS